MNRDAKRTADSPIGQQHVSTVTVGEFERQLGLRGETGGKNKTSGTGETGTRRREALRHTRAVCEGLNGETARRSRVSAIAVEAS